MHATKQKPWAFETRFKAYVQYITYRRVSYKRAILLTKITVKQIESL